MAAHDEILELCAELHKSGAKLTYDTIREARGRGSRRDISAALREWRHRQTQAITAASLEMPNHVAQMGDDLVKSLWSAMEKEFAQMRLEIRVETDLLAYTANEEIEELHKIISDQVDELEQLRSEIKCLRAKLKQKD